MRVRVKATCFCQEWGRERREKVSWGSGDSEVSDVLGFHYLWRQTLYHHGNQVLERIYRCPGFWENTIMSDKTLISIFHRSCAMEYFSWFGVIYPNAFNLFCKTAIKSSFSLFQIRLSSFSIICLSFLFTRYKCMSKGSRFFLYTALHVCSFLFPLLPVSSITSS